MAEVNIVEAMERIIVAAGEGGVPVSSIEIAPEKLTINFGDAEKLQKTSDNSPVGKYDANAKMLESLLNGQADGGVEIGAEAEIKGKTTIADIHIEQREGELESEVKIAGIPQDLAEMSSDKIQQQADFVQPAPEELNMLQPTNEPIVTEQTTEQQVVVTENGVKVTSEKNNTGQTIFKVDYDATTVTPQQLESELNNISQSGGLGENGNIIVAQIMQQATNPNLDISAPEQGLAQANPMMDSPEIRQLPVAATNTAQANSQIGAREYKGVVPTQQAQVSGSMKI